MRAKACELAVQVVNNEEHESEDQAAGKLLGMCIFFDSYISHGCSWTERHMGLMKAARAERRRKGAKEVKLVKSQ